MRWLSPMPVWPAITAGVQPPLGVTDTAQPFSSAVSTLVVPRRNVRSNSASAIGGCAGIFECQASRYLRYGFFAPWNGYGSPGRMSGDPYPFQGAKNPYLKYLERIR